MSSRESSDLDPNAQSSAVRAKSFRALLTEAGFDLAALAAALGVRTTTVRAYSRGDYPIPDARLTTLATLVGEPVARRLAELAAPPARVKGPGRGRLPAPGSPAERRALRVAQAVANRER